MGNIQKTLDSLQPYVIGIRYLQGTPLVDCVFKEGWSVPEDPIIKREKGDDSMNYYMLFSDSPKVGLDDLLGYVEKTIKMNLDREKKHDLLRMKVEELKNIFKNNSLAKLKNLKFTFSDEQLVPTLEEFNLDIDDSFAEEGYPSNGITDPYEEEEINQQPQQPIAYLDENNNPIELTEEDRELMEEEARAERNRLITEKRKEKQANTPAPKKASRVELPPKRKMEPQIHDNGYHGCDCGPDEACGVCIDSKGY